MARIMSFSPIYFSIAIFALIHFIKQSHGLSIELIHPFSPESPFYKPNITLFEMIKRVSRRTRPRRQAASINNNWSNMKVIRPVLEQISGSHLAKLNLGIFPGENPTHKTYYFGFDTGSDLTWLQCEDCATQGNECFPQQDPLYPNSKSETYTRLMYGRNHQLCYPNEYIGQFCAYRIHYGDGSYSLGILAYETFSFDATHTLWIVMGCGLRNKLVFPGEESKETGLLGMSWGPHSFVNQINTISHGRFSYCLTPIIGHDQHSTTLLRFGSDTPALRELQSLHIHQHSDEDHYYVILHDISINSQRLNIPPQYFTKTHNGGGCMLDSGTIYTYISEPAYSILKEEMIRYLARAEPNLKIKSWGELDLCFRRYHLFKGHAHLPSITFHFEGNVNLVLRPDIAFWVNRKAGKEVICMLIMPSFYKDLSVIGSQSQANHVFVFDLPSKKVYIGPRDCAQNP